MEFKPTKVRNIKGNSHKIGSFVVAPKVLVTAFGKPDIGDEHKTSGEYGFEGENGIQVSLYDWKRTSLYFIGPGYPSPRKFWAGDTPCEFSIGGTDEEHAAPFIEWLTRRLING
jgi:hypothetical protein